jgi:nitrogen fixation protein FixH
MEANRERQQRGEMTGAMVLICLLVFFGVVFAVNGVLVHAAISTFGGVETTSSYQAGLKFEQDVATAQRQDARHWQVNGNLRRDGAGRTVLDVTAYDEKGVALSGLTAEARLAHPANERLDHTISLRAGAAGVFHGSVEAQPGQWDLIIDLYRGDQRLFRSSNRVTLN